MPNVRQSPTPARSNISAPPPKEYYTPGRWRVTPAPPPPNLESALAKPPNFKPEKARREDAQKKRNEAKQRENAARKENAAPKEPQKP
jgi:hypothetical protein